MMEYEFRLPRRDNLIFNVIEQALKTGAITFDFDRPFPDTGDVTPIHSDISLLLKNEDDKNLVRDLLIETMIAEVKSYRYKYSLATTSSTNLYMAKSIGEFLNKPVMELPSSLKYSLDEINTSPKNPLYASMMLLESVISSPEDATRILRVVNEIRNKGRHCDTCLALFNYEMPKSEEILRLAEKYDIDSANRKKFRVITAIPFYDLARRANIYGYITKDQVEELYVWKQDPKAWSVRNMHKARKTPEREILLR